MRLYQKWLRLVERRFDDPAIIETSSGQTWTFGELEASASEAIEKGEERIIAADERGIAFIRLTLRAWRLNRPLLPLDPGQTAPDIGSLPQGIAHLKITSGTTGIPRVVLFSAEQLVADVEQIISTMELSPSSPNLGVISLAHSYGFSNLVLPLLLHGIPLILVENPLPGTVQDVLSQHRHVTLPAVPAMWRAWHQAGILSSNIRLAISAGAPLNLELERSVFESVGLKIHNFYGASECGGIAFDRQRTPRESSELIGTPLDGVSLACDTDGRLLVSSPAVGERYLEDQRGDRLGGGVFLTQDLGRIEPSGALYLCGRLGESINVAGRKLSPAGIESALLRCSGVRFALVFGIPSRNSERLEEIVAVVHLEREVRIEAVRQELAKQLPVWEQPRHWWPCEELQPDARGKLSRCGWRERYLLHTQGASCN